MYSLPVVVCALRDHDLYEPVFSRINMEWFPSAYQSILEALKECHEDEPGRIIPWKDIKLRLKGKKGYGKIAEVIRASKGASTIAQRKQLSRFIQSEMVKDVVQEIAEKTDAHEIIDHEKVIKQLEVAMEAGQMKRRLFDYFDEDPSARMKVYDSVPVVSLPSAELSSALRGGAAAGQLVTVLAPTDGGKTMFLINCARHAVASGLTVLYTTHETPRHEVGQRFDSSFTRKSYEWLREHSDKLAKRLNEIRRKGGNLVIEDFSEVEGSVSDVRVAADKVVRMHGKVDLIVVDYGDLLKSSRRYDNKRHEHQLVWQELRRLGKRFNCPVITATQANRQGAAHGEVELIHVGESWAKMTDTDVCLIVFAPKDRNRALIIIGKTKRKGIYSKIPVVFDRKRCYIE